MRKPGDPISISVSAFVDLTPPKAFCASVEVTQIVYGLEDELRQVDLDWPNQM